jgi:pyrroline-5-carboxylate reductase
MKVKRISFIGSGRVAAFIAEGLEKAKSDIELLAYDLDPEASAKLASRHTRVKDAKGSLEAACGADLVLLALHPQAIMQGHEALSASLAKAPGIVVSLAPKLRIPALASTLKKGVAARCIPNAPSAIGMGYNPVAFADGASGAERAAVLEFLKPLGEAPEVPDAALEAYAVLSAMGPTYLWPLLDEMGRLGGGFGLSAEAARQAVAATARGAAGLYGSGRPYAELMDMIPLKPMADSEAAIREAFASKLGATFAKLTS